MSLLALTLRCQEWLGTNQDAQEFLQYLCSALEDDQASASGNGVNVGTPRH